MIPYDVPLPIMLGCLFIFGAVVGSFLNVCIYRIPQHERLWDQLSGLNHPPSTCPFCKKRILATDNIPIFGWMMLGGRCRFCRHSIPIRYALIELFNGLLWVALYIAIVPAGYHARVESSVLYSHLGSLGQTNLDHASLVWLVNAQYLYFLVLAEALLVATFIDFDLMVIPDGVTVPAMIVGLIGGAVLGAPTLWPTWFFSAQELNGMQPLFPAYLQWLFTLPEQIPWLNAHPHLHGFVNSLAGWVVGGGSVWLVRILGHRAFGREAMGFGDVVLMAMVGSFLGWQPSLMVFFMLAPICALAATVCVLVATFSLKALGEIPFGPYLSVGALLIVFFWRPWFSQFEIFFSRGPFLFVVFGLMGLLFFPLLLLTRITLRGIKRRFGIEDEWYEEVAAEWTSADQLAFYANKEERMKASWPGISTGLGTSFTNRWRGRN